MDWMWGAGKCSQGFWAEGLQDGVISWGHEDQDVVRLCYVINKIHQALTVCQALLQDWRAGWHAAYPPGAHTEPGSERRGFAKATHSEKRAGVQSPSLHFHPEWETSGLMPADGWAGTSLPD